MISNKTGASPLGTIYPSPTTRGPYDEDKKSNMSDLLTRNQFPLPVERQQVETDWRTRGYSCAQFVDPPGQKWMDFVHACNELVTVVEGRLEMIVADQQYFMESGDEVFIPKDAVHSVINAHDGVSMWLYGYD